MAGPRIRTHAFKFSDADKERVRDLIAKYIESSSATVPNLEDAEVLKHFNFLFTHLNELANDPGPNIAAKLFKIFVNLTNITNQRPDKKRDQLFQLASMIYVKVFTNNPEYSKFVVAREQQQSEPTKKFIIEKDKLAQASQAGGLGISLTAAEVVYANIQYQRIYERIAVASINDQENAARLGDIAKTLNLPHVYSAVCKKLAGLGQDAINATINDMIKSPENQVALLTKIGVPLSESARLQVENKPANRVDVTSEVKQLDSEAAPVTEPSVSLGPTLAELHAKHDAAEERRRNLDEERRKREEKRALRDVQRSQQVTRAVPKNSDQIVKQPSLPEQLPKQWKKLSKLVKLIKKIALKKQSDKRDAQQSDAEANLNGLREEIWQSLDLGKKLPAYITQQQIIDLVLTQINSSEYQTDFSKKYLELMNNSFIERFLLNKGEDSYGKDKKTFLKSKKIRGGEQAKEKELNAWAEMGKTQICKIFSEDNYVHLKQALYAYLYLQTRQTIPEEHADEAINELERQRIVYIRNAVDKEIQKKWEALQQNLTLKLTQQIDKPKEDLFISAHLDQENDIQRDNATFTVKMDFLPPCIDRDGLIKLMLTDRLARTQEFQRPVVLDRFFGSAPLEALAELQRQSEFYKIAGETLEEVNQLIARLSQDPRVLAAQTLEDKLQVVPASPIIVEEQKLVLESQAPQMPSLEASENNAPVTAPAEVIITMPVEPVQLPPLDQVRESRENLAESKKEDGSPVVAEKKEILLTEEQIKAKEQRKARKEREAKDAVLEAKRAALAEKLMREQEEKQSKPLQTGTESLKRKEKERKDIWAQFLKNYKRFEKEKAKLKAQHSADDTYDPIEDIGVAKIARMNNLATNTWSLFLEGKPLPDYITQQYVSGLLFLEIGTDLKPKDISRQYLPAISDSFIERLLLNRGSTEHKKSHSKNSKKWVNLGKAYALGVFQRNGTDCLQLQKALYGYLYRHSQDTEIALIKDAVDKNLQEKWQKLQAALENKIAHQDLKSSSEIQELRKNILFITKFPLPKWMTQEGLVKWILVDHQAASGQEFYSQKAILDRLLESGYTAIAEKINTTCVNYGLTHQALDQARSALRMLEIANDKYNGISHSVENKINDESKLEQGTSEVIDEFKSAIGVVDQLGSEGSLTRDELEKAIAAAKKLDSAVNAIEKLDKGTDHYAKAVVALEQVVSTKVDGKSQNAIVRLQGILMTRTLDFVLGKVTALQEYLSTEAVKRQSDQKLELESKEKEAEEKKPDVPDQVPQATPEQKKQRIIEISARQSVVTKTDYQEFPAYLDRYFVRDLRDAKESYDEAELMQRYRSVKGEFLKEHLPAWITQERLLKLSPLLGLEIIRAMNQNPALINRAIVGRKGERNRHPQSSVVNMLSDIVGCIAREFKGDAGESQRNTFQTLLVACVLGKEFKVNDNEAVLFIAFLMADDHNRKKLAGRYGKQIIGYFNDIKLLVWPQLSEEQQKFWNLFCQYYADPEQYENVDLSLRFDQVNTFVQAVQKAQQASMKSMISHQQFVQYFRNNLTQPILSPQFLKLAESDEFLDRLFLNKGTEAYKNAEGIFSRVRGKNQQKDDWASTGAICAGEILFSEGKVSLELKRAVYHYLERFSKVAAFIKDPQQQQEGARVAKIKQAMDERLHARWRGLQIILKQRFAAQNEKKDDVLQSSITINNDVALIVTLSPLPSWFDQDSLIKLIIADPASRAESFYKKPSVLERLLGQNPQQALGELRKQADVAKAGSREQIFNLIEQLSQIAQQQQLQEFDAYIERYLGLAARDEKESYSFADCTHRFTPIAASLFSAVLPEGITQERLLKWDKALGPRLRELITAGNSLLLERLVLGAEDEKKEPLKNPEQVVTILKDIVIHFSQQKESDDYYKLFQHQLAKTMLECVPYNIEGREAILLFAFLIADKENRRELNNSFGKILSDYIERYRIDEQVHSSLEQAHPDNIIRYQSSWQMFCTSLEGPAGDSLEFSLSEVSALVQALQAVIVNPVDTSHEQLIEFFLGNINSFDLDGATLDKILLNKGTPEYENASKEQKVQWAKAGQSCAVAVFTNKSVASAIQRAFYDYLQENTRLNPLDDSQRVQEILHLKNIKQFVDAALRDKLDDERPDISFIARSYPAWPKSFVEEKLTKFVAEKEEREVAKQLRAEQEEQEKARREAERLQRIAEEKMRREAAEKAREEKARQIQEEISTLCQDRLSLVKQCLDMYLVKVREIERYDVAVRQSSSPRLFRAPAIAVRVLPSIAAQEIRIPLHVTRKIVDDPKLADSKPADLSSPHVDRSVLAKGKTAINLIEGDEKKGSYEEYMTESGIYNIRVRTRSTSLDQSEKYQSFGAGMIAPNDEYLKFADKQIISFISAMGADEKIYIRSKDLVMAEAYLLICKARGLSYENESCMQDDFYPEAISLIHRKIADGTLEKLVDVDLSQQIEELRRIEARLRELTSAPNDPDVLAAQRLIAKIAKGEDLVSAEKREVHELASKLQPRVASIIPKFHH